jgi:hypothetical protein
MFQSDTPRLIERRGFLFASGAALAGLAYGLYRMESVRAQPEAPLGPPQLVTIIEFTDDGERKGAVSVLTIQKSEAEWRRQLSFVERARQGRLPLHLLRYRSFRLGHEIRLWNGLAELLGSHSQGKRCRSDG